MSELIGRTFGSYVLDGLIAQDALGARYRARHARLGRPAVVRVLRRSLADPSGAEATALTTALQAAAQLSHPNIAELLDFGTQDGRAFVVSELLPDESLRQLLDGYALNRTPWPLTLAVDLLRQAAEGVGYAHRQKEAHGNLAPDALLLQRQSTDAFLLKVTDWGLSGFGAGGDAAAPYRAPEAQPGRASDARADVYALGVMLHEAATGLLPGTGAEQRRLLLLPEIDSVVRRALARDPLQRYATADELAQVLRGLLRDLSPNATVLLAAPPTLTPDQAPTIAVASPVTPPPPVTAPPAVDPLLTALLQSQPTPPSSQVSPAATQMATPGRIGIALGQEQLVLTPGEEQLLDVTLSNAGNTPDLFTLSVEGVPNNWVRAPERPISLAPGQRGLAQLLIVVPREAASRAGDYGVIVRARSTLNPLESNTARARWAVRSFANGSLALSPTRASARDEASFALALRNDGNAPARYSLYAEDDEGVLEYVLSSEQVDVGPGETARVGLTLTAPRRLYGNGRLRRFRVVAEGPDGSTTNATGQLIHTALLPEWAPLLLIALALLGVLSYLLLRRERGLTAEEAAIATATAIAQQTPLPTPTAEPGAPQVLQYSVVPPVVAPGQEVTVTWEVSGATRVVIAQFGDVEPAGQRVFRPEETTDFQLTAEGGGRTTTRIERVNVVQPSPVPTEVPTVTAQAPTSTPEAASPEPTVVPPTPLPPTPEPTVVPPTPLPPTPVPATPVPPTVVPPTLPPPPPPPAPEALDLRAAAPDADWSTNAGELVFGDPPAGEEAQGYATLITGTLLGGPVLSDGSRPDEALLLVPPTVADGFVEGRYASVAVQDGQRLMGQIGFARGVAADDFLIEVRFDDELLAQETVQAGGPLLALDVDLAPVANRQGTLSIRVVSPQAQPQPIGLYWVDGRVAGP